MSNQEQYVTITHYKEREFYFLNYAIQTEDGIIPKEIEQFHESDKVEFVKKIRTLQSQHPNNHIVSISLLANQTISQENDRNRTTARIFSDNFVTQESIDIGDIPTTLYFSPFAILYQQYKDILDDKITLLIGLFDRKLFMIFATTDRIHQSWIIGTRGLTEKQVADRVYKSMQAYFKISYSFADHIEMLISDDSPKLLKVLREELSLHIELHQNSIHNLLHNMASSQEVAESSYIKSFKKIELSPRSTRSKIAEHSTKNYSEIKRRALPENQNLNDIMIKDNRGFFDSIKSIFSGASMASAVPLLIVLAVGGFFSMKNGTILNQINQKSMQISAHQTNLNLTAVSQKLFKAIGKNGELKKATISTKEVDIRGVVWGIEPLKNSLNKLYKDGKFVIKPLENFMTEFSFTAK
ncbi:hypothetical protein MNB_SV-12-1106 [hydrothermal vent metagenome]|uniref:Uncharacterized protein n=1 Tax=hydrothermal vent metagenome TaxID=652676 RepID=A0A1W1BBG9_9ZZZZ